MATAKVDQAAGEPGAGEPEVPSCVRPSLTQPLERAEARSLSRVLKALADPTRLQLVSLINSAPDGEACVCDLTEVLGLRQPTVSHHLKVLVDAGLLQRERRATWVWYSLVPEAWRTFRESLR